MTRAPLLLVLAGCALPSPPSVRPSPCPDSDCRWTNLATVVDSGITAGAAPGAVVGVSTHGIRYVHGTGRLGDSLPTMPGAATLYDLASVTKVVGLTTAAMFAVDDGVIRLDDRVVAHLPAFTGGGRDEVTIRHLLTHSSGLPAHRRLWDVAPDRRAAMDAAVATALDTLPGTRSVYSDLGAIVLTRLLEARYGMRLDSLLEQRLFQPLGMDHTRFRPAADWRPDIAPTEQDPWRGRMIHGEVHDENAAWLGGVSGHAGLFAPAADLLRFGEWLLDQLNGRRTAGCDANCPSLRPGTVREFFRRQELVPGATRALGWDTPSPTGSSAGERLASVSVGHTGFTGTSIWLDPSRELVVVLLANRVHPTRDNPRFGPLRGVTANRAIEVLEGPGPGPGIR